MRVLNNLSGKTKIAALLLQINDKYQKRGN